MQFFSMSDSILVWPTGPSAGAQPKPMASCAFYLHMELGGVRRRGFVASVGTWFLRCWVLASAQNVCHPLHLASALAAPAISLLPRRMSAPGPVILVLVFIFMSPCLQQIMIMFIMRSWCVYLTHLNPFYVPFLSLHLVPFLSYWLQKIYLPVSYYLLFCSFIYTLCFSYKRSHMTFKPLCLIYFT